MTRAELIERLAEKNPHLTPKDIALAVHAILDGLSHTLVRGGRIEIRGFGVFGNAHRKPRTARNPRTGAKVWVPAKYVPHFKAGKALRERVDYE